MVSRTLAQKLTSTLLAVLVSAAVLWWLLGDGSGDALIEALRKATLWPLLIGSLLAVAIQIIRAWRFAILEYGGLAPPSWTMIGIATKLVLFNFLLPFKLGELSFPLMMKRAYGTPFGRGAGMLILCRLLDLGVVLAIILVTTAWLLDPAVHGWNPMLIGAIGVIVLATPFLVLDHLSWLQRLTAHSPSMAQLASQLGHGASIMRPYRIRLPVAMLTVSIWIAHAAIAWLAATAIAANLGFVSMAMASAASNLAFALPISGVAGLGPPQAAWATMLHLAGHDWTPAITSALLCHGLLLTTFSILGTAFLIGQRSRATAAIDSKSDISSIRGG